MRKAFLYVATIFLTTLLWPVTSSAEKSTEALQRCLLDNTTGKDRKNLAKWIFVGMSGHPEISQISKVNPADSESIHRATGEIFTRLLAEQCTSEIQAAFKTSRSNGTKLAFEYLGRMAMQELISDPNVNSTMSEFQKYVDRKKLERALTPK